MTRTAVAATSIAVYDEIKSDGTLTRQQAAIVSLMRRGRDYSLQELVNLTGFGVNVVSGRCNELRQAGAIEHGPKRPCSVTGRTIQPVRLPALAGHQEALFS